MSKLHYKIKQLLFHSLQMLTVLVMICSFFSFNVTNAKAAGDQEVITKFHSTILIQEDSSLLVSEEITVQVMNQKINHGIYRDFPTVYKDHYVFKRTTGFDVVSVKKDGEREPYFTETIEGGMRVYIGDEDVLVTPGLHTYLLTYTTTRQLTENSNNDELYYNLTGNFWEFPILTSSATIVLPGSYPSKEITSEVFTGAYGETGNDADISISQGDKTIITVTGSKILQPNEGLTAKIQWPKGAVSVNSVNSVYYFFLDNLEIPVTVVFLIGLLLFYLFFWHKYGRDPKKKSVFPLFFPPENISPAAMRYIDRMAYDDKVLVASVMNLGVNKYLKVSEQENNGIFGLGKSIHYVIEKLENPDPVMHAEEKVILEQLLSNTVLVLNGQYNSGLASAVAQFQKTIDDVYQKPYFRRNIWCIIVGIMISGINVLLLGLMHPGYQYITAPFILPLILFAILSLILCFTSIRVLIIASIIIIPLFGLFFLYYVSPVLASIFTVLLLITQLFIHALFVFLLPARTEAGQRLQEQIEGFKLFLSTTEEDNLKIMYKELPRDFSTFEKYLPFAIALGVEMKWISQFKSLFDQNPEMLHNTALWYAGSTHSIADANFASAFSSTFSSAMTSSSSSGGSSGGGGGGGGGGGW